MAEVLAHLVMELQALDHSEVGAGWVRPTSDPAVYRIAMPYHEEEFGEACVEAALTFCLAAIDGQSYNVAAEVARLRELADSHGCGAVVEAVFAEARLRRIPAARPQPRLAKHLIVLGQGVNAQHFRHGRTNCTGAIAESLSTDKDLTKSMLRTAGVPVPDGRPASDADDAWAAATAIGLPVVVKPQDCDYGEGVSLNLSTREQVVSAFAAARALSENVLVERCVPGIEHRLLVVGNRVVAATLREPPQVVGDGGATVLELVARENASPRRGDGGTSVLEKIEFDTTALAVVAEQGFAPDSVPPAGACVLIRRNTHRHSGGTAVDVTERVHPEVAARVTDAVAVVGLDVAGVDIVATDISQPLEEQNGAIIEVNAGPALFMHLRPSAGKSRPVIHEILNLMFSQGDTGRIPVVAVTGTNGKTTTTRLIAHVLAETGRAVGMTCSDGIYIKGRRIETGDCSGPNSARTVLLNPLVEAAVLETARGGILTGGLGFDQCDVAVVTNLGGGDHLGSHGVETLEEMAAVKATVLKALAPAGFAVVNAGDAMVGAMAEASPAPLVYFAIDGNVPRLRSHRQQGGRAAFVRSGIIIWADGNVETEVVSLTDVPLTHKGRISFQVENALAAAAAVLALGLAIEAVRNGLESFMADPERVPGRFNVFEIDGAVLIVDYAHNASAIEALTHSINTRFPVCDRVIAYSSAGNRRDEDIVRQGAARRKRLRSSPAV